MKALKLLVTTVFLASITACAGGTETTPAKEEPQTTGNVSGKFTPAVVGAEVKLSDSTEEVIASTKSNSDGSYSVPVPVGVIGLITITTSISSVSSQTINFTGEDYPRVDFDVPPGRDPCAPPVAPGEVEEPPSPGSGRC